MTVVRTGREASTGYKHCCPGQRFFTLYHTEAKLLDEIQKKVLRIFLLAIHGHLYSFALRFLFLKIMQPLTYFYSSFTVHCKGDKRKTDRKPYPLPYGLRNPYRNLKSESLKLCPETSTKLLVHEFVFWTVLSICTECVHCCSLPKLNFTSALPQYGLSFSYITSFHSDPMCILII
jgi:hypothetical protein